MSDRSRELLRSSRFDAFKKCTVVGRVVYPKARKAFGWPDVARISKALTDRDQIPTRDQLVAAAQTWLRISILLGEGIARVAIDATELPRDLVLFVPGMAREAGKLLIVFAEVARTAVRNILTNLIDIIQ